MTEQNVNTLDYRTITISRADLRKRMTEIGDTTTTDWESIDQRAVDAFAALTNNMDPMHNEPRYVQQAGIFGGSTIVNGIFVAALIPGWLKQIPYGLVYTTGNGYSLNYGLDRVRWLQPLPVGERFRATFKLVDAIEKTPGRFRMQYDVEVLRELSDDPVMVASSIVLLVVDD